MTDTGEDHLAETALVLAQEWGLRVAGPEGAGANRAMLLEALSERVAWLLSHDPQKLMRALYILDISERRYLQALDQPTAHDRAWDLATAIYDRETEKIASRKCYAKRAPGNQLP